jgi:hypothetical protein
MNDPALKYRDQVSPDHAIAMQSIGLARLLMQQHQQYFEKFLKARSDMDSFGGLLNPTLYRDVLASKSFEQQVRMVEAAHAFLQEINAVAGELPQAKFTMEGER